MRFLHKKLQERREQGTFRTLKPFLGGIDFYSNDYLGMSTHEGIRADAKQLLLQNELFVRNGSAGSRLLSGNFPFYEETEAFLAGFYGAEAALVYHSGYDAILGTLSCLPARTDTVLYDELIHASARDGIRLSSARNHPFRHNDLQDLETKIKKAEGQVFVAVESIYSMDGDMAPLSELYTLQQRYGFVLLIDEAHAGGIYGDRGKGLAQDFANGENTVRFITFGKAYGTEGACVLGSKTLREYLVNFSRPFIYTTAPSPEFFARLRASVEIVGNADDKRESLHANIRTFRQVLSHYFACNASPIQIYRPDSPDRLKNITAGLHDSGIAVLPIFAPTVKRGEERLRIVIHAFNDEYQIEGLAEAILR